MPMGIVTDEEFDKERTDSNSSIKKPHSTTVITNEKGRGLGNVEVPDSLRKVIGNTSIEDSPSEAIQLARNFGISASSASAYGVGATSTTSYNDRPNVSAVLDTKSRVQKSAMNKLKMALNSITSDKLTDAKPRDLSGIAKDMSVVIKNMEPEKSQNPSGDNAGPTFIIYAPQIRKEESYDAVYAKE